MSTNHQLSKKQTGRKPRQYKIRRIAIDKCPQKKGTCVKVLTTTPRKPNSALRKIAKVILSNRKYIAAYIPGIGHNLQKHSTVLVRGGRVKDLPGMKYKIIRGKFDLRSLEIRSTSRSKYGAKKVYNRVDHRYYRPRYFT